MNTKIETPKPIDVTLERCELRNGKIIIVLKPDLLSRQQFSPNVFYDEGAKANMLQYVNIVVTINEKDGELKATSGYNGTHYTTGHTQLHDALGKQFINPKDHALDWAMNEPSHECTRSKSTLAMERPSIQVIRPMVQSMQKKGSIRVATPTNCFRG